MHNEQLFSACLGRKRVIGTFKKPSRLDLHHLPEEKQLINNGEGFDVLGVTSYKTWMS